MGSAPSGAFVEELYDTNAATLATDTIPGVLRAGQVNEIVIARFLILRYADGICTGSAGATTVRDDI